MGTVVIALQILLALVFLMSGLTKLLGHQMQRDNFKRWGYPSWSMRVTGAVELTGAIVLIVGLWVPAAGVIAALLLATTMVGAIFTHIRIKDRQWLPSSVLLVLALIGAFLPVTELLV